jgi:rubrerythrin
MSHHDHSDHHHTDPHHHHHDHEHHEPSAEMPFSEKMAKLLQHWIKHNSDHAVTYQEWAAKSRENGLSDLAERIEQIAEMTQQINEKLSQAQNLVPGKPV